MSSCFAFGDLCGSLLHTLVARCVSWVFELWRGKNLRVKVLGGWSSRRNAWQLEGVVTVKSGSSEVVVLVECLCSVGKFTVKSHRAVGVFGYSGMVGVVFDP